MISLILENIFSCLLLVCTAAALAKYILLHAICTQLVHIDTSVTAIVRNFEVQRTLY